MKTKLAVLNLFSMAAAFASIIGCGTSLNKDLTPDALAGFWERTEVSAETYDGGPVEFRDYETGPVVFNISNETMKRVLFVGVTNTGICNEAQPYTISGNKVQMQKTSKCAAMEYEFTAFDGNKASVQYDAGGAYIKMSFQRIESTKLEQLAQEYGATDIRE